MAVKYFHARMPGRDKIHLVPATELSLDDRFASRMVAGDEMHFFRKEDGTARSLCGKWSDAWVVGGPAFAAECEICRAKR